MGNRKPPAAAHGGTKPETHRLLTAAAYFLQHRNFPDATNYARRAMDSDPAHPGPAQILSIAQILSRPKTADHYALLNLPQFEPDVDLIGSSSETLILKLNPDSNPYPFSAEAYELVAKARSVLSSPAEKAAYDEGLRRELGTFWTVCPYCYYVYEYDRVYEDCCLRCSNGGCRRVLHAVAIRGPGPPEEVVERGYYLCGGFMPFEVWDGNGGKVRESSWCPFVSQSGFGTGGGGRGFGKNGEGAVVEISDDEMGGNGDAETVEGMGCRGSGNGKKARIEGSGNVGGTYGERPSCRGGDEKELKIRSNVGNLTYGVGEEWHSNVDDNEGEGLESEIGGETSNEGGSGVEFFDGDNDVFVGLQCDFDLGNAAA